MLRLTALALPLLIACAPDEPPVTVGDIEFEGPPGSAEPFVAATADGRAVLTWFEPLDEEQGRWALRLAVRAAGGWSAPRTVVEGRAFFVNWADFPSFVELADGTWVVHWLEKSGPGTYAYHVKVALSHDEGRSWSAPVVPHRDDSDTEHGFVSMVPFGPGASLVWLDGRAMHVKEGARGAEDYIRGAMTVRATTLASDGSLGPDQLLDERTCECCQTALARTTSGLVAAYRDRSDAEIRDIAVVRYVDGAWSHPIRVAEDNWHIPGCPVNGPQLSAVGDTVAIAWYTAAENVQRVLTAFSTDAGASWSAPARVDEGDPAGRVDIEMLDGDAAVVVWVERRQGQQADIRARRVTRSGRLESPWTVSGTHGSRGSGFPRMTRVGDELVIAWTMLGDDGGVRVRAVTW